MMEFDPYKWFLKISRGWLILLILVNLGSLAIFAADKDDQNWGFLYSSIVANISVSYLVLIFMWMNRDALTMYQVTESNDPFHEWVWFSSPSIERWVTRLCFVVWMTPNLMHLFSLSGALSWMVGIFFIISLIWWTFIFIMMLKSFFSKEDSLLLPR